MHFYQHISHSHCNIIQTMSRQLFFHPQLDDEIYGSTKAFPFYFWRQMQSIKITFALLVPRNFPLDEDFQFLSLPFRTFFILVIRRH